MAETIGARFKRSWNAFFNRDPTQEYQDAGATYYRRPDRVVYSRGREKSIVTSVLNRIAMDAASIDILHVKLDKEGRYTETIDSDLNNCLTLEANIDQTARSFRQDIYASILDEGCIAIAPIDVDRDPTDGSFKIYTMRTGKIVQWKPKTVKINAYNERNGRREDIFMAKQTTAIVENPFYAVFNEPSSTLQRLIRKLNLLDAIDEQSGSGKLDVIIQLPYVIKTEARRQQAEERRKSIEDQLKGPYGIAYTDGTERIVQLNRPVENNLMKQIEYLTSMLYSQLGITQAIMDGTADEKMMTNYYTRTIEPLVSAVVDEMKRKFLSKTARSQNQSIIYLRDPFKLIPVTEIATIADTFTRNRILSANEVRQMVGRKPSSDPEADKLVNSNISQPNGEAQEQPESSEEVTEEGEIQNGA